MRRCITSAVERFREMTHELLNLQGMERRDYCEL